MTTTIEPTTDPTLDWVDYSTLTAINMCPRWGIIHAYHGKRFAHGVERAMPLEAGRAMHDVFACVRLFDMLEHYFNGKDALLDDISSYASALLGKDRWTEALKYFANVNEDAETRCMQMALSILETSGFHDSPTDNKRTQSNLEAAAINYVQRYPLGRFIPVYKYNGIHVGVEVPFDVTIKFTDRAPIRFVGRIDALCFDTMRKQAIPEIHENKTGARIDTVWSNSFDTSHQVTGYCVAMCAVTNEEISEAHIWGTQLPVPKSSLYGDGSTRYPVTRTAREHLTWLAWVEHTLSILDKHDTTPWNAPMYTHSCNRYFRSCSFIPLCVETEELRKHVFENEMVAERWNPLIGIEPTLAVD